MYTIKIFLKQNMRRLENVLYLSVAHQLCIKRKFINMYKYPANLTKNIQYRFGCIRSFSATLFYIVPAYTSIVSVIRTPQHKKYYIQTQTDPSQGPFMI